MLLLLLPPQNAMTSWGTDDTIFAFLTVSFGVSTRGQSSKGGKNTRYSHSSCMCDDHFSLVNVIVAFVCKYTGCAKCRCAFEWTAFCWILRDA